MTLPNELRIFISSTFRDLQEEREHLVKKIFPEIRALCRKRGVTFTEVDLRWGLTKEEVEQGGVISICLEEIERCKPYFIGILGERYGWVPPRDHILDPGLEKYPWLREEGADEQSITEMEIRYGALLHSHNEVDAFFYFRHRDATPDEFRESDPGQIRRLDELKRAIRESRFPVREGFRDPGELGEQIRDDLLRVIEQRFPGADAPDPEEQERAAHEAFALARRRAYVPDDTTVSELLGMIEAGRQGIVVTGPSGTGKSALIAYIASLYRTEHPEDLLIEHYVGATASALDHHGMMLRIMSEIRQRYGIERPLPNTPEGIERSFPAWLAYAHDRPLVILLDAVNQLPEQSRTLHWLPTHLPPTLRLIVSTTAGPTLDTLRDRGYALLTVPSLGGEQRRRLVEGYLAEFRKKLLPEQLERILADERSDSPLFLRTVVEELRVFGLYEELDRRIDEMLATTDLDDLFQRILARMESDYGADLVGQSMMFIWASRGGLTESELLDLLNGPTPMQGMTLRSFNRLDLSAFLLALDYHLLRNAGQLHFFHDYLRRAVESRYVLPVGQGDSRESRSRKCAREVLHRRIADYLHERTIDLPEVSRRDARELAYQLHAAGDLNRLALTLSSPPHLLAMSEGGADIEVLGYWARLREHRLRPEEFYPNAIAMYESGGVDDARLCAVLQLIAALFERLGLWDEATEIHARQLRIASENRLVEEEGRALTGLGGLLRLKGEPEAALEYMERARALFTDNGQDRNANRTLCNIGLVHTGRAEFDRALECLQQASEKYLQWDDRHGYARTVGDMGSVHAMRGEFERALECFRLQQETCEQFGDLNGMSNAVGNRGSVYLNLGEYDRALECYRQSIEADEQLGDLRGLASIIGNMGIIYRERQEYDNAEECFERRLRMCTELGDRSGAATASGNLGLLYLDRGRYDRALECLNYYREESEEIGDQRGVATATGNLGMLFHTLGEYERSRDLLLENIRISGELGELIGLARATGNLGVLYHDMGDLQPALECYREAAEAYRSMDSYHHVAPLYAGEARLILELLAEHRERPDWIGRFVPEAAGAEWRKALLNSVRSTLSEYHHLTREHPSPEAECEGDILEARVAAADSDDHRAATLLLGRLGDHLEERQRAELHYWLWRVAPDAGAEHRAAAEDLYATLFARVPNHLYRKRLTELRSTEGDS